jgi:hypothetical protein
MNNNSKSNKYAARINYGNRQIDKWAKWAINKMGKIKYEDLMEQRKMYNLDK